MLIFLPLFFAVDPLPPAGEQRTFQTPAGFRVELVAAEPAVIDPIACAFDELGRLFVVEMPGYPNAGVGKGNPRIPGRIRLLVDRDGDGRFETSTIFADGLRFPTSVLPWRNGVLVCDAPDLLFFAADPGASAAKSRTVLYTGFGNDNIQQMLNGLQFHHDGWVYGCNGANASEISSPMKGMPAVPLRGRHFRFDPDRPSSLQPLSGGGQYGMSPNDAGAWFTATNSEHLKQIVFEDRYLANNPYLKAPAVTINVSDHGSAAKLFRRSPFEAWRVERTGRRVKGPEAKRLPPTELVPGGFVTSTCGTLVYRGGAFGNLYHENVLTCDPANNLIHRDVLFPSGVTYRGARHDLNCEFLASTDNWFRPTFLATGPTGELFVTDFYREIIETPISLPDDIKAANNLESRSRGRIWRVTAAAKNSPVPRSFPSDPVSWVGELSSPNSWRRSTAHRLLQSLEVPSPAVVAGVANFATNPAASHAIVHAIALLDRWGSPTTEALQLALANQDPAIRESSLRLAEPLGKRNPEIQHLALGLANDPNIRVRFQLACSLGNWQEPAVIPALATILRLSPGDEWIELAVLSASAGKSEALLASLANVATISDQFRARLVAADRGGQKDAAKTLESLLASNSEKTSALLSPGRASLIESLLDSIANSSKGFSGTLAGNPNLRAQLNRLWDTLELETWKQPNLSTADRRQIISLIAFSSKAHDGFWRFCLLPTQPAEIQYTAIRAQRRRADCWDTNENRSARFSILIDAFASLTPAGRSEALEVLLTSKPGILAMFKAIGSKKMSVRDIPPIYRSLLRRHQDAEVRLQAMQLELDAQDGDRRAASRLKLIEKYSAALQLSGNIAKGQASFQKICANCHRLGGTGPQVGPDLKAALLNKNKPILLVDLLDPNREIDPRYVTYVIVEKSGRTVTGLLAVETATSITLRRQGGAEDTVLRVDIEQITSTGQSLMPEDLEKQLSISEVADLLEFLMANK